MNSAFIPRWLALGLLAACASASFAQPATAPANPRDAGPWASTSAENNKPGLPTLYIASDSTAAPGNPTHRGWGAVLVDYFDTSKVNIVNAAVGGRSFRTFTSEGRWDKIVETLKAGDYVIIELGHNDGGDPSAARSRGDVKGIGDETVEVVSRNQDGTSRTEVVHSYGWYTRKYVKDAQAKGAIPIVSTTTVRNMWSQDDKVERGMGEMREWAKQVAEQEHALFLDHSNITADAYEKMGFDAVQKFFPADHTHTSTDGAIANAEHLIAGLKGLKGIDPLLAALTEKGKAIEAAPYNEKWATYNPPGPKKGN